MVSWSFALTTFKIFPCFQKVKHGSFQTMSTTLLGCLFSNVNKEIVTVLKALVNRSKVHDFIKASFPEVSGFHSAYSQRLTHSQTHTVKHRQSHIQTHTHMHTCTHTRTHAITHARMRFVMLCSLKTFIIRKVIHGLFQIVSATLLGRLSFNAHKEIVIVLEDVSKEMERACL